MAEPSFVQLSELEKLFDPEVVGTQKINCIKLLRQISGDGLRESRDFLEQTIQPIIEGKKPRTPQLMAQPNFDPDEIMTRLEYLTNEVNKLKRVQISKQAKGIFND